MRWNTNMKKQHWNLIQNLVMWIISATVFMPVVLIIINAFKTKTEASDMSMRLPTVIQWSNFATVFEEAKLGFSFMNSMIYATISVVLGIVLASMAAFVLSRRRTKLNNFIYMFIILGITLPVNHVALMRIMQMSHLINTRVGLSLLYTALQMPFSVFLIYGFIASVPRELDEAAILDGANPYRLFFSIILPLLKPVSFTVLILNFMNSWNEFILPLYYLNDTAKWPITLAVYNFFGKYEMEWNLVCADIVLTCIPVIIIYLFGQRYIIEGMTSGAVKG